MDVHAETSEKQKNKRKKTINEKLENKNIVEGGESTLSEDEIIEQFNVTKSGELPRMSSKSKSHF
ncbi:MAG: hypothetical protein ACE5EJ_01100 [Nitrosopumilaceae archaeon]